MKNNFGDICLFLSPFTCLHLFEQYKLHYLHTILLGSYEDQFHILLVYVEPKILAICILGLPHEVPIFQHDLRKSQQEFVFYDWAFCGSDK